MKNLVNYLTFSGDCEEALNFYKDTFGGEYSISMRYGDSPAPCPDSQKDKIMHATFTSDGFMLMASDGPADYDKKRGDNVSLMLDFSDEAEEEKVYNALSSGGKVNQPLQDTFWGARFGMVTDKFGINWMLNFTKVQPQSN
ncbi:MAG: VOC family protein [Methanococcaceae archaeon]